MSRKGMEKMNFQECLNNYIRGTDSLQWKRTGVTAKYPKRLSAGIAKVSVHLQLTVNI